MAMKVSEYDPTFVCFGNVRYSNAGFDPGAVTYAQMCERADAILRDAACLHVSAMNSTTHPNQVAVAYDLACLVQSCAELASVFGIFDISNFIQMVCKEKEKQGLMADRMTDKQFEFIEKLRAHEKRVVAEQSRLQEGNEQNAQKSSEK